MSNREQDMENSHYLNQANRLFPEDPQDEFGETDADYNIKTGQTFGENEETTLSKQEWRDA